MSGPNDTVVCSEDSFTLPHWEPHLGSPKRQLQTQHMEKEKTNIEEVMEMIPPILRLTPTTSATSTDWADMIDVSHPVPEFREKIKDMAQTYPFDLDNFQKQAILKLEEGHHVLVAAHTSAGKTVVAEYAIAISRRNGTRAIYTSPIKALSNQKYKDLDMLFGDVGLLTGDLHVNPAASCLVLTTEILLSMVYTGYSMENIQIVVLDEVHYINNTERGHVWEEILILLPSHVRLVLLSATLPDPLQFATWLGHTKQRKVYVVSTSKRPVPLCHFLFTGVSHGSKNEKFLVVDQDGNFLLPGYNEAVAAKKSREPEIIQLPGDTLGKSSERKLSRSEKRTMWQSLLDHLKEQDKLPVVVFMFSRFRCEDTADSLMTEDFTTATEKSRIRSCFRKCLEDKLNEQDRDLPQVLKFQRFLQNGIGVHHSGVLPLLREIVEILFQCGFIKVLFATETLAVGVNLPARTVVFEDIKKFDREQYRALTPAEYAQMAGRAGRRGLDDTGSVIILCNAGVPKLATLKDMILGKPQQLTSHFRLTYRMILNLLRTKVMSVEGMMQRSFREFQQINQPTTDNYSKQLQLAEKEYSEKCRTPLASHLARLEPFYRAAAEYIDVLKEIMPILLTTANITKEMVPGKILVVSTGPYINQLGVLLNNKTTLGLGPKQAPYKVLLLDTKIEENFDFDENFYRMLGFSAMYDSIGTKEKTLDHTVLNIMPQDIIAVTKMNMKIDHKVIIDVWERRQLPRFKDAPIGPTCTSAVQELSRISCAVYSGITTLDYINLTESLSNSTKEILSAIEKMNKCKQELKELMKCTDIADFKTEFAKVYERKLIKLKRDKYRQLSLGHLALYPDYQKRLMVLRELNYIDEHDSVMPKGQVACGIGTYELMITELVFRDVFTDMSPAEIAALLSGFVYQRQTKTGNKTTWSGRTDKLEEGLKAIEEIEAELSAIESKYSGGQCQGQAERPNFELMSIVHEWALQMPLAQLMNCAVVEEGIIVRCIQQLHELLVNLQNAVTAVGNLKLQALLMETASAIRRDIICSISLSPQEQEDTLLVNVQDAAAAVRDLKLQVIMIDAQPQPIYHARARRNDESAEGEGAVKLNEEKARPD